jgi:capsular exopolysaccharide synthesis family protein
LYVVDAKIKKVKARQERLTNLITQYQERVDRTPMHEQQLLSLMRDYNNTEGNYRALLDKNLKANISQNIESRMGEEEFRILEHATAPRKPIRPDLLNIILMAMVSGIGAGVGMVMFVESRDTSFSKSEDLGKATGLKILCTIPHFTMPKRRPEKHHRKRFETHHGDAPGPPSVILDQPKSVMAEQYRLLCAQISRPSQDVAKQVFAFTSAVMEEGKSTTAFNVAVSMAHDFKKRTLLIEADLYKGTGSPLSMGNELGLADVLMTKVPLESALIHFQASNLTVLPRGHVENLNPVEVLGRSGVRELVEGLRKRFDYIVIDCPPLLPGVSTGLIAEVVDAMVVVVRAERTPRALVLQAVDSIQRSKIIGIVFNNVRSFEVPSKYYYPYYSHV